MELNRKEVPLYGQVDGCVLLQETAPKDAKFYVVAQGSSLTHVTTAKRGSDERTLCFTVPGHDRVEVVSVTAYISLNDGVHPHGCNASLEYVRDVAQDAAEYLSGAWDQSGPQSYQELVRKFPVLAQAADEEFSGGLLECRERERQLRGSSGDDIDLRHLDQKITLALANMDYPQQWKNTDREPRQGSEHRPKETLIHLAVRLHFVHLACFLIHQTGVQRLLSLPNEEGETPLQLAQRDGLHSTFRDLAVPSVAAVDPPPGVFCLWADSSCMLRFCPGTESVFLTLRQAPRCPQDAIMVLKERLEDHSICRQMNFLRPDAWKHKCNKNEAPLNDGGFSKELNVDGNPLGENVFEDQPTLFLIDTDSEEENSSSLSVNGQPSQNTEVQNQFSQCASDSLLSMIDGSNQSLAQPTQSCEEDVKFKVDDVTSDSTGTDGSLWDPEDLLLATDTPPPHSHLEDLLPASIPGLPSLSPVDQALTRLSRRPSTEPNSHTDSPPMETCDISLVALEVDSEEEAPVPKSLLSRLFSDIGKSEDKKETPRPAPDLSCTRSQSASAYEPVSKDLSEEGVRLRSYSYSYSKFCPSRSPRDNHTSEGSPEQRASSISEQSTDKREVRFRKRAQSADDEGSVELAESLQHLTLSEFLKEIEEEELEKCNIPTKAESEKYKVIRTFSFLKNRMSSTRNKNKGKGKDREGKDRHLNGHRFGSGSCLGSTMCVVCDKPASGKDLLHCSGCTTIVHKSCKESVPPCMKKLQDRYAMTVVKSKTASLPQSFTVRESTPHSMIPISVSQPVLTPKERKEAVTQSGSLPGSLPNSDSLLSESSETESEALKPSSHSEELLPTPGSSASNESTLGEDCVDSYIQTYSDILADSAEYDGESWSLTVEHKFCKRQDKRAVKRQDVIYELMQTELHHLQTLHIMAEVFRRGMKEEVQLDSEAVERVFPCLDQLLGFHHAFFAAMKERRQSSGQPQGHRNYLIQQIGDILLQQFSEENGEKMKQVYGEFCSHHNEAVSFFKDLLLHNKRFQSFIKQQGHNSLVRRREIPECILLVTQRITKYPVLLERILHYTQEDTEEHGNLSKALAHIREVIAAVDLRVSEYERHQRLQEVWNRMENRSSAKLKSGLAFRKQDMMWPGQTLRYQGMLLWKTATGRLKDVLALLLTDVLILLQEKDQKYTFATVDQKPPVISLQKLIVREVANEEKGMFLISASSAGPEMYEVHTSSKEERNTWMRLIREAVESCPEEPEECSSESEEERRTAEARFQKILKLQESLTCQDQQIRSSLEEKLQIYKELSALTGRRDAAQVEARLLVQPQAEELPQAAGLLAAALQEAESLKAALSSKARSLSSHSQDSDSVFPVSPSALSDPASDSSEDNGGSQTDAFEIQSVWPKNDNSSLDLEAAESVQTLTQLLYSLQAAVTIQDTCYEVQRLLLQASERSPRTHCLHLHGLGGSTLQEQEKQRNLEKRREEVATAKRLREQLRQEKERWERECHLKEIQQVEEESRLEERERKCQLAAEKLRQEREELEEQLDEYQQSLERLREGQRIVEREQERLEDQQKLLQAWTHGRQSSLPTMIPHMVIPLDGHQASPPNNSRQHGGVGSVFVNEAAFGGGGGINNCHAHHKRNDPNAHNCFNSLLDRSNNRRYPVVTSPLGTSYIYNPLGRLQHSTSDPSYNGETWMSTADPNPEPPHPSEHQLELSALVSLETDSDQEEGREETIVFL